MTLEQDHSFMQHALRLAGRGRYGVSPNPMVGCVLVRNGSVIGEGFHERAGLPHAEVEALAAAGNDASGATAYVTLEPCSHHGRTPPCADALIAAGVARVVVAAGDPSDEVGGKGLRALRAAGIEVTEGVCEQEARRLNETFLHAAVAKRPFLLLKAGMTLDGKLATIERRSRWITSEPAREKSLELREEFDAILVGSGTVAADDPRLTRRLRLNRSIVPWTRIVVDSDGHLAPESRIFDGEAPTIIFTTRPGALAVRNAEVVPMNEGESKVDLEKVLAELYRRGIRSVIAEGGSIVHSDLIARDLWQKMILFVAPMIIGGATAPSLFGGDGVAELADAYRLTFDAIEKVGPDVMITAYPAARN